MKVTSEVKSKEGVIVRFEKENACDFDDTNITVVDGEKEISFTMPMSEFMLGFTAANGGLLGIFSGIKQEGE